MKHLAQAMAEIKSTDSTKVAEHMEKGAKFDVLKTARRLLPQLGPPADAGDVHDPLPADGRDQGPVGPLHHVAAPVPGASQSLEVIAPTREDNNCTLPCMT